VDHWDFATNGPLWIGLVNDTVGEVRDVQIQHPRAGLIATAPPWNVPLYEPSKAKITWPNGAYATIYSAETPEKLRGPGFQMAWADEPGKWSQAGRFETLSNLKKCLREKREDGNRVQLLMSSTPQETEEFFAILDDPRVIKTFGTTWDNAHFLDDGAMEDAEAEKDTPEGRREYLAIVNRKVAGAAWEPEWIDEFRVREGDEYNFGLPSSVKPKRVVVAIDPSAGSKDPNDAAETGIVVACLGSDGHFYVLDDLSLKAGPEEWGPQALRAYEDFDGDVIVGEINNGGDMVEHVIRTVPQGADYPSGKNVPFEEVRATKGKAVRCEPVVSLYKRGKVHHVTTFPRLEYQMTHFKPNKPEELKQKDRMDALVWAITVLAALDKKRTSGKCAIGGRRLALPSAMETPSVGMLGPVTKPYGYD
jgi:phage terminase large subunit-like protein